MNGSDPMAAKALVEFDVSNLWRIENVADPLAGIITIHTKLVLKGGVTCQDSDVAPKFFSAVTTVFRGQPMTVQFEIPASTLGAAIAQWRVAAEQAAQKHVEDMESSYNRAMLTRPGPASALSRTGKLVN